MELRIFVAGKNNSRRAVTFKVELSKISSCHWQSQSLGAARRSIGGRPQSDAEIAIFLYRWRSGNDMDHSGKGRIDHTVKAQKMNGRKLPEEPFSATHEQQSKAEESHV